MSIYSWILLINVALLLIYGSWYDLKYKMVEHWLWITIVIIGIINVGFFSASQIDSLAVVFFTATVWGLPCFFTFGIGDFALIMGMAMFIPNVESMWMFFLIILIIWVAYTIVLMIQRKIILTRKAFFFKEYALVPVLAFSFYLWAILEAVL